MAEQLSRRDFLAGSLVAGAGALVAGRTALADPPGLVRIAAPQAFRFVHLTDIHVQPERAADMGFAKALRAVEALRPRPDFILTGGDLVFDVMKTDAVRARKLFQLLRTVVADNTDLPVRYTVGNHDIFGWQTPGVTRETPGYGRALITEQLGLDGTYYTFDHKGWRFIVLDNIQPASGSYGYVGGLDGAQRDWLVQTLRRTSATMPIVFCEHIPVVSGVPFAYETNRQEEGWVIRDSFICGDAVWRIDAIRNHRVSLCLSGHLHQLDRVDFRGTTYICGGAVSGNWWKGPRDGVQEGFGIIDCTVDGRTHYEYFDYGWDARA
ncbi:MAG: metallophosphoesterase [Phycisphaerae bacterium]|nr:metallophosphoesterase [Phycisphaerae bacterium]